MRGIEALESRVGVAVAALPHAGQPYADRSFVEVLVRAALLEGGLGRTDRDRPLADVVAPGATVLLKPNWVFHENASGASNDCLITHPSFIEAALKEVLAAGAARIIIADAPIQLCDWDRLHPVGWADGLRRLAGPRATVEVVDLRRTVVRGEGFSSAVEVDQRALERFVLFDLGAKSLLEPVTRSGNFRITNYDPRTLRAAHSPGHHEYLIAKEVFEADVILSLPKLKTHRKAGLTGALKNLVGVNGSKDYLPHHRVGGTAMGGDAYDGWSPTQRAIEFLLDQANMRIGTRSYSRWKAASWGLLRARSRFRETDVEGGWRGNDTVWRMCLDINRVVRYGLPDGTLSATPVRNVLTLTDAIVAGEGDGPLAPTPLATGVVSFAHSQAFGDLFHAGLMGYTWSRIPIVRESFREDPYRLVTSSPGACMVGFDGDTVDLRSFVDERSFAFRAPRGWQNAIERYAPDTRGSAAAKTA